MTESLQVLLAELERFGEANDHVTTERPRRMLNITRDTGEFLSVLVQATSAFLIQFSPQPLRSKHPPHGCGPQESLFTGSAKKPAYYPILFEQSGMHHLGQSAGGPYPQH